MHVQIFALRTGSEQNEQNNVDAHLQQVLLSCSSSDVHPVSQNIAALQYSGNTHTKQSAL